MMNCLDIANEYFDAWNAHDADAIVKTFADDGTYRDPTTGEISGDAIGANAKRLWDAFPDLSFEIVSVAEAGPGRVVAEWIMKGTNAGAFRGLPATGRAVSLPGADVIEIGTDGIKAVRGYFDTRVFAEQLGLQVLIQPFAVGPFSFGNSVAVQSGKKTKPGAFGITTIWNTDEETEEIRALSRAAATEMLRMEGFIGVTLIRIGGRGVTISAWEKPEQTRQLLGSGTHAEAMRKFWAGLGESAYTSVWIPDHINPLWIRCTMCHKMNDYEKNSGVCTCGQPLPEAHSYF
ncbi:MAG TPA: nuclear transport factor 2 family protein [Thiobacillaceae bacterium]|nr:nuclear transport factor 2 family protein [Thiobacillaceae bacterium]